MLRAPFLLFAKPPQLDDCPMLPLAFFVMLVQQQQQQQQKQQNYFPTTPNLPTKIIPAKIA